MSSVADLAIAILTQAERRVEIAGQNLANATTPAYKRRVAFSALVSTSANGDVSSPRVSTAIDFTIGKLSETGNPADLAITGPGYFALRSDNATIYSRQGQFAISQDGRLVTPQGFALQLTNGSDLVVKSRDFEIRPDGTVYEKGASIGRVAVFAPDRKSTRLNSSHG